MKLKLILLLAALMGATATVAQQPVMRTDAQGFLDRARQMVTRHNYVGAVDQLNHLRHYMACTDNQRELAEYLQALSEFELENDNSVAALKHFVSRYPSSLLASDAQFRVGNYYFFHGAYDDALVNYSIVREGALNETEDENLLYRKAYCHLQLGQWDEARDYYRRLADTKRYGAATTFYEAYIDYAHGEYDSALEKFSQIDRTGELGYQSQFYVAQIDFVNGDFDKVIDLGTSLIEDNDNDYFTAEMNRLVGESYYHKGNNAAKARQHLERYMETTEDDVVRSAAYSLGVLDYNDGRYDEAMKMMNFVTGEDDAMAQSALLYLGQCHLRTGDTNQAAMAFEQAASMRHDDKVREEAFYNYAISQNQGGRTPFNKSIDMFENFLNEFPNSQYKNKVEDYLYDAYLTSTDYERVLASINRIKNPGAKVLKAKQNVLYNLGVQAKSNGRNDEAANLFKQALATGGSDAVTTAETKLWLGEAQYRQGDYDNAVRNLQEYVKASNGKDKNYALAQYYLGHTLLKQERYDESRKAFEKAVSTGKLDKDLLADAYNRIGDTKYYQQDIAGAQAAYDAAVSHAKSTGDAADVAEAMYNKALMAGESGNQAAKVQQLDELLKAYPKWERVAEAQLEKAKALIKQNDLAKATTVVENLAKNHRGKEEARAALLMLANAQLESGDKTKAIATYRRIISDYPTSIQASHAAEDLKQLYAEQGKLDELGAFLKGIKGAPKLDVSEVEKLTFNAAENAAIDGNIGKMQNYLSQYPNGSYAPQAHYYVGRYYYENGKLDKALPEINQALELGGDATYAEDALAIKSETLAGMGRHDEAIAVYKELERRASTPAGITVAQMGLMRAAKGAKRWNEVIECATRLLNTADIDAQVQKEAILTRAQAYKAQGKSSEAQADLKRIAGDTQNEYGIQAAYELAKMQYDAKDYKGAEKALLKIIDEGTPHEYWLAKCFILVSDTFYKEGRTQDAINYLKSLKNNYPGKEGEIFNEIETRLAQWDKSAQNKKKTNKK